MSEVSTRSGQRGSEAELLQRHRAGEEVSLRALAAELAQEVRLLRVLHAFGDHVDAQALAEQEDALDDLDLPLVADHGADEGAVDLQRVDGQLVQVAERR